VALKDLKKTFLRDFLTSKSRVHKVLKNLGSYIKILGCRNMAGNKFHSEDPKILDLSVKKKNYFEFLAYHPNSKLKALGISY